MRRAAFLVACLSLALTSLAPLTAPVAAQQELPPAFVGRWEGVSHELPTNAPVPVTVDLTGGRLGAVVGTMALPDHSCGGDVTLQRVAADGSQVELAVKITFGTACIDGGIVTLTLQTAESVFYDWRHPAVQVTATGTLTRTGAAPMPEPTLVPTPMPTPVPPTATSEPVPTDVAVQPDAAAFAAALAARADAPSLTGPLAGDLVRSASAFPAAVGAGVTVEDFSATATFVNPPQATTIPWDFGLSFGRTPDTSQQIVIFSNGSWSYWTAPEGNMRSGAAPSIDSAPGGVNTVDLVVADGIALFAVNGVFVASIELLRTGAADVEVITGFPSPPLPTEEGRQLTYTDFQVWAFPAVTSRGVPAEDLGDRALAPEFAALLPTADEVPVGLTAIGEAARTRQEVIDALGGTEEAARRLEEWGWSGSVFREFIADDEAAGPNGTTYLNVSVTRFADAESAAAALIFFADQVIGTQDLQEVQSPAIGERTRLLEGAPDGVPLTVLYLQQGPILYRIGASSSRETGNPTADVLAVAGASLLAAPAVAFLTTDPAECTVTPRTAASFPPLVTDAEVAADAALVALTEAIATPGLDIPAGAPADPMVTAAVVDTYRQFTACSSGGDELAAFALWTDDALRQLTIEPPTDAPDPAEEPWAFRVSDVRILPDGRVVAVWEVRGPDEGTVEQGTLVQALEWQGDRYLVEETLDIVLPADSGAALIPLPEVSAALPAAFVGHWEGTVAWDDATMPVSLDLTGGSVGEVIGTVEYALYGSAGPRCGGAVSLENIAADGGEIVLEGTITYDAAVCLVDATIQISLQDTGAVGYLWNHPSLTVSGTGALIHTIPKN